MAYGQDLNASAKRHLRAAEELYNVNSAGCQPGCGAVAGYLYGLSGELAVKEIMRDSGMKPNDVTSRRDDPFYAHFEELKVILRDTIRGRRAGELRLIAEDGKLFQSWHTSMRYAPTAQITDAFIQSWRESAKRLIDKMDEI